jgi:soluble lytic murein transglycosylase-like protein
MGSIGSLGRPGSSMYRRNHCRVLFLSCGFALSLLPCQAIRADQIITLLDARGRKIYVNTSEPPTRAQWVTRSFRETRQNPSPPTNIEQLVQQTSDRFQVDPKLVHAIIKVESAYDPNAISSKGAMGLMQLIPATAQRYGVGNPFDPRQNLEGGVNYLKYLLDMFGGDLELSLAAYNAGEHRVSRGGAVPPITETRDYVRRVSRLYRNEPGASQLASASKPAAKEPPKAPIVRYVDAQGIVHYTNVD